MCMRRHWEHTSRLISMTREKTRMWCPWSKSRHLREGRRVSWRIRARASLSKGRIYNRRSQSIWGGRANLSTSSKILMEKSSPLLRMSITLIGQSKKYNFAKVLAWPLHFCKSTMTKSPPLRPGSENHAWSELPLRFPMFQPQRTRQ